MSFLQFLLSQTLFLLSFILLSYLFLGLSLPQTFANYLFNFIQFFGGGLLLALYLRQAKPYADVLSVTLSFNLVTYIILVIMEVTLPGWLEIAQDFLLVTLLSLVGAYLGRKRQ